MLAETPTLERTDIHPSLVEVLDLSTQGNLIPIYRELPADLDTPVSVYLKLAGQGASFLLESVEGGEQVGRYSFIGIEPNAVLSFKGRAYTRRSSNRTNAADLPQGKDPLHVLQEELARFTPVTLPGLPRFVGGLVGYLGYDVIRFFEPKLDSGAAVASDLPEALYLLTDTLVAFDHARGRLLIIVNAHLNGDIEAAYRDASERIDRIADRLSEASPSLANARLPQGERHSLPAATLTSNFTPAGFEDIVRAAKEHIAAGDIFQVVLSQRLSRCTSAQPFDIYRALRRLNPSPYMFFFDFGAVNGKPYHVIGASPEMSVRLEGRTATVRPIAGTRRRGSTPTEDAVLEQELLVDPKERAEHVMLVDLERNDLGRVCEYGTVHLPDLFVVERYSHVMHLVSQVEGQLRDDLNAFDLLRATFPVGTVSGAPKVRAMELIRDLERLERGLYAGAVGYFSYDGAMDTCIAIRTLSMLGDVVSIQAGAGIVADSDPASEYQETLNKAKALAVAIELAEK
ncbi:MAG TPA: anthranilate synthase component I [Anaerolineae bacterium]|nr:anthranilate synthase component I [Anaerolineae bacterium]